jgi:hypothetical protein
MRIKIDNRFEYPIGLTSKQKEICRRLDGFYVSIHAFKPNIMPSEIYVGALYVISTRNFGNFDWMAQAAHSLRELLYSFYLEYKRKEDKDKKKKKYLIEKNFIFTEELFDKVNSCYCKITDIAHHFTDPLNYTKHEILHFNEAAFLELVEEYENLLYHLLTQPIDAFVEIDNMLFNKSLSEVDIDQIKIYISNELTKQYFYLKADHEHLYFLEKNQFLDLKIDSLEIGLNGEIVLDSVISELKYLKKVLDKDPQKVTEIILKIIPPVARFDPRILYHLFEVVEELPRESISLIINKIHKEEWVSNLEDLNHFVFAHDDIFKRLSDIADIRSLLNLSYSILSVRKNKHVNIYNVHYIFEPPFHFKDIHYSGVFNFLNDVIEKESNVLLQDVLKNLLSILNEMFLLRDISVDRISDKQTIFPYPVDFYDLNIENEEEDIYDTHVTKFLCIVKKIIKKIVIDSKDKKNAKKIFDEIIYKLLPESDLKVSISLYVYSNSYSIFKKPLREYIFKIFNESLSDTERSDMHYSEYYQIVAKTFNSLNSKDKERYISCVLDLKGSYSDDKFSEINRKIGKKVLSIITKFLNEDQLSKLVERFGVADSLVESHIHIEEGWGSSKNKTSSKSPFEDLDINLIPDLLISDLAPETLAKLNIDRSYFDQFNAEHVGKLLESDIKKRPNQYLQKAILFFDRNKIAPHYTYSFLNGLLECFKECTDKIIVSDLRSLFTLFHEIEKSYENFAFEINPNFDRQYYGWNSGWDDVHSVIADIMKEILNEKFYPVYRNEIFQTLDYLFAYTRNYISPKNISEAKILVKSPEQKEALISDRYTSAINSARGKTFLAFESFLVTESRSFYEDLNSFIADDSKILFDRILEEEKSEEIYFLIGFYFNDFYFLDRDWFEERLNIIFPKNPDSKNLFLSSLEGFLTKKIIHKEIFNNDAFDEIYTKAIKNKHEDKNRRYFNDPKHGIGTHLGAAYLYFDSFSTSSKFFKTLFYQSHIQSKRHFIRTIGRMIQSNDPKKIEFYKKSKNLSEKLLILWDYFLERSKRKVDVDISCLEEFAHWMTFENDIFTPECLAERIYNTLELTKGNLSLKDNLSDVICVISKCKPELSLEIISLSFLGENVTERSIYRLLRSERNWFDSLKFIYDNNHKLRKDVESFINKYISKYNNDFLGFLNVIK